MSVISEVLRDEFGGATDTDSTTELLRPVPVPPIYTTRVTRATTPERPISLQTTPTHSPGRRRSVMSPLHHSTPHVFTRSRASQPHTPHALTYENSPPRVVPTTRDSASSSPVPDLTITELHTTDTSPRSLAADQLDPRMEQAMHTPLPPSDVDSAPPSSADNTLDHSSASAQPLGDSRDDVLATLYNNYLTGPGSKVNVQRAKVNVRGSKGKRQRAVRRRSKRVEASV